MAFIFTRAGAPAIYGEGLEPQLGGLVFSRAGAPAIYGEGLEPQLGSYAVDELRGLGEAPADWPPFARDFAAWCRKNKKVIEPLASGLQMLGAQLLPSVVFSIPGAQLVFIGTTLVFFMAEGQPASVVKTQAKIAKQYCDVQSAVFGIATLVAPFTGVGLAAAPALLVATTLAAVLGRIFGALSEGRSPRTEDLVQLVDLGGTKISDKLEPLKPLFRQIDEVLGAGKKIPFLSDKVKVFKKVMAAAPPVPKKTAAAPTKAAKPKTKKASLESEGEGVLPKKRLPLALPLALVGGLAAFLVVTRK